MKSKSFKHLLNAVSIISQDTGHDENDILKCIEICVSLGMEPDRAIRLLKAQMNLCPSRKDLKAGISRIEISGHGGTAIFTHADRMHYSRIIKVMKSMTGKITIKEKLQNENYKGSS